MHLVVENGSKLMLVSWKCMSTLSPGYVTWRTNKYN